MKISFLIVLLSMCEKKTASQQLISQWSIDFGSLHMWKSTGHATKIPLSFIHVLTGKVRPEKERLRYSRYAHSLHSTEHILSETIRKLLSIKENGEKHVPQIPEQLSHVNSAQILSRESHVQKCDRVCHFFTVYAKVIRCKLPSGARRGTYNHVTIMTDH